MKRILSSVLAFMMVLSCFAGVIVFNASAEDLPVEFIVDANTLATTGSGIHNLGIELKDDDGTYCRYTVQGGDPYVWYNGLASTVNNYQFMEVTYRTSSTDNPIGGYFMNTNNYQCIDFPYEPDGQWHTTVIDLSMNPQWSPNNTVFRFDPQTAGSEAGGGVVDYKQVRFFNATEANNTGDFATTEVFYDFMPASGSYSWTAGATFATGAGFIGIAKGSILRAEYRTDGGAWVNANASFFNWDEASSNPAGTWDSICQGAVPNCYGSDVNTAYCSGVYVKSVETLASGLHTIEVRFMTDEYKYALWTYVLDIVDYKEEVTPRGGAFIFSGAADFAVRYNFPMDIGSLTLNAVATYSGDGKVIKFEVFKWDTDYATTVAGTPLHTVNVEGHVDCQDLTLDFSGLGLKGDLLLRGTPVEGIFTPLISDYPGTTQAFMAGQPLQGGEKSISFSWAAACPTEIIYDATESGLFVQADSLGDSGASFYGKAKRFGFVEYDGFTKLYQTADGLENYCMAAGANIAKTYKYAAVVYRTASPYVKFEIYLDDQRAGSYGYNEGETIVTDNTWQVAYIPIDTSVVSGAYANNFRFDFMEGNNVPAGESIDVAYIGVFKSEGAAKAYDFDVKHLNKNQYIYSAEVREGNIDYFEGAQGGPSTGSTPFGVKFDVTLDKLLGFEFVNMATYSSATTKGVMKLYKWDTDLATTRASEPIFTQEIINPGDNAGVKLDFSEYNFGKGTYYCEATVTDGQWTPWDAAGATTNGATCYVGTSEHPFRARSYQYGKVETNVCIGDPTTNDVTYEIDFSHYSENAPKEYGFANANALKYDKVLDQGYVHFDVTGGDPYVMLNNCVPTTYTNLAKYAVVKYRTDADGVFQFFHNRKDGYTMGNRQDPTFPVTGDGEWHVVVADLSIDGWANNLGGQFSAFRLDGVNSGSTYFDVSYIKFYANLEPAQAQYESELTSRTDRTVIPAKNVITIKEPVQGQPETDVEYDLANINLTYSNIDGGVIKTEWTAAGYPAGSAMMDLGWNNFGYMGEIDFSKYSKVTLWVASDTSMPADNVAGIPAIVGFKSSNSSFGWADQTGYQLTNSIAYGEVGAANDETRISPSGRGEGGWADKERKVEIDLTDVNYSGHTWLTSFSIKGYRTDNGTAAGYGMLVTKVVFTEKAIEAEAGVFAGVPDCDYEIIDDEYYVPAIVNEYDYAPVATKYTNEVKYANGYSVAVDQSFLVNGVELNEEDVSASAWVKANLASKYLDKKNNVDTITFKGWLGNLNVAAFGYAIDDGDAIFDTTFTAGTDADIKAEGGPNSVYYEINADVSGLTEGSFNITPVVKTTDGSVYLLGEWGTFNYKVGKQTYKVFGDWHKVTFVNGELIEVPYEAVDGGYTNTTDPLSCDTLYANGYCVQDGNADQTLAALGGVHNEDYSVANFALRGWYGSPSNGEIASFGYALNDGEPIWGDFTQATEDAVKNAAGTEYASRYMVTIDTTNLANGCYNVYILVKHTNGTVVTLGKWNTVLYQGKQTYAKPGDCYFYYDVVHENIAKTPAIPVNPADVTGYIYFDGAELYTGDLQVTTEATYDKDGAYTHFVALGGDSQYYQFRGTEYEIGKYLAIKYRCETNLSTEGFIGNGGGATGSGDHYGATFIGNEAWNVLVVNLEEQGIYSGKANYFRFDFIAGTGEVDVKWVGFFQKVEDIDTFDKLIWKAPAYYTATFVNEAGETVKAIDYKSGTEKLAGVPKVPAKDGYDGAWEEYTLNGDITVKPVYTAKATEETTQADTTPADTSDVPQLKDPKVFDVWTAGAIKGVFSTNCNQTEVTVNDDGVNFHYVAPTAEGALPDPYVTFNVSKYIKAVGGDAVNGTVTPVILLKIKTTNADGGFEIYAKSEAGDSNSTTYVGNGEWEYIIIDMYDTSLSDTKKVNTLRFDWSTGEPIGDLTIGLISFFASEEAAEAYANGGVTPPAGGDDTTAEETTAVEADTTAATAETTVATAETTVADGEDKGCCSVLGLGAVAIVAVLGAGYVVIRKKKD